MLSRSQADEPHNSAMRCVRWSAWGIGEEGLQHIKLQPRSIPMAGLRTCTSVMTCGSGGGRRQTADVSVCLG
jgi:hypothetical protein